MTSQTLSELTILFLLLLASARVFFIESERKDPLSITPLAAFIFAALNLFAWGVSIQEIIVLFLSFWVFIWNFRALLRLNQNLIIDHYSPLFILISTINCFLLVIATGFIFFFRPVYTNLDRISVNKTTKYLCGNLTEGFKECEDVFDQKDLTFVRYSPSAGRQDDKTAIIFLPAECASVQHYEPFLAKLARDGYTIYSADFFSDDTKPEDSFLFSREMKRFTFVRSRLRESDFYKNWCSEKKEALFMTMFENLRKLLPEEKELIVVGDGLPKDLYISLIWKDECYSRCFDIANIADYPTPGWGPVEQTDPFLALTLGLRRDGASYTANRMASTLEQMIENKSSPH